MNLCSMEIIKWAQLQMCIKKLASPKTKSPVLIRRGFFYKHLLLFFKNNMIHLLYYA